MFEKYHPHKEVYLLEKNKENKDKEKENKEKKFSNHTAFRYTSWGMESQTLPICFCFARSDKMCDHSNRVKVSWEEEEEEENCTLLSTASAKGGRQ